jgi:glyoxylase-like metal-dependent hydrolase (beta-lactamase superfamily II)
MACARFAQRPTRRQFACWCAAAACADLASPLTALAAAEEGGATAQGMTPMRVAEGAYFVQGQSALGTSANQNFISNAGFVITDAGVVVIDALGSPVLAQRLLAEIRKLTALPVKYVIVTHYHADHIYGLQVFKDAGATVVGHALARDYLASDAAQQRLQISRQDIAPWVDAHTRLVPPDLWVGQPDPHADTMLRVGNTEFVLRPVGPSHTPEDLVVHVPALGLLYVGDLMFRGRLPFVGQADSGGWIRALNRMLALQPKVVVPGHGAASTDPQADLALTRDYLQYLRDRMGEGVRNMEAFDEVYSRTDWSRYSAMPLFEAVNRMNAYNTYLLMEREGP